jgi:probable F420-dependent oxidoreductase
VGIQLPEVERRVPWPEYRALARAAEQAGFDSIWVGDHLLYREPDRGPWEAWTLLAALAAATERVRLGPLVACTAFHPPALIAKMAATIAEVSGGRFVLGLGAGWNEVEFRAFGLPYDRRVARFEESFAAIRRLLAGEWVTMRGRFVELDDAVLAPAPAEPPPLMIGSNGPRMLAATLPYADAWNTWFEDYGNRAEGFAGLNARVSAAVADSGRQQAEVARSACVFVRLGAGGERDAQAPPLVPRDLAGELPALHEAGADEAILVADPVDERSVRELGDAVAALRL